MSKPTVEIMKVTPKWATERLDAHDKAIREGKFRQRPMNDNAVNRYADDMRASNWALTGQGITFDEDGNLIDGQHRLAAIVKAGVPVEMVVTFGVPSTVARGVATIDTIDIGRGRSMAQQLKIDGMEYYSEVGSAARITLLMAVPWISNSAPRIAAIRVAQMMHNHYLSLIKTLRAGGNDKPKWSGKILAPLGLLRTVDDTTADMFAEEFSEMANLAKQSPVLQFHKFLARPNTAGGGTDYQMSVVKALCSALYFYSHDEKVENIRGNDEHVTWLLRESKKVVTEIRRICSPNLTQEEMRAI